MALAEVAADVKIAHRCGDPRAGFLDGGNQLGDRVPQCVDPLARAVERGWAMVLCRTCAATGCRSAVWLIAGVSGAAALIHLLFEMPSWLSLSYINVTLSLVLALQIVLAVLRTPLRDWWVIGVAAAVIVIAVAWMYLLRRHVRKQHLSRLGVVTTAVVGALGTLITLGTTWYFTEYLPRTSLPKVDLTSELVALGQSGSVVHLSAKITVHNQGTLTVQPIGSLMRVMADPAGMASITAEPENIAKGIDFDYPASGNSASMRLTSVTANCSTATTSSTRPRSFSPRRPLCISEPSTWTPRPTRVSG